MQIVWNTHGTVRPNATVLRTTAQFFSARVARSLLVGKPYTFKFVALRTALLFAFSV